MVVTARPFVVWSRCPKKSYVSRGLIPSLPENKILNNFVLGIVPNVAPKIDLHVQSSYNSSVFAEFVSSIWTSTIQ